MSTTFEIEQDFIAEQNRAGSDWLAEDFEYLGKSFAGEVSISTILSKRLKASRSPCLRGEWVPAAHVLPDFRGRANRAGIYEKLEDCATINKLVRVTAAVSLHIPWDKPDNARTLRSAAEKLGLKFDAMNSNTFQDQPGQKQSYKFGSLSHTDAAVRRRRSSIISSVSRSAKRSVRKR